MPEASRLKSRLSLRTVRSISRRRWLYLPRLFSPRERWIVGALAIAVVISSIGLFLRLGARFTVAAPATGGVLREGTLREPRFINPILASNDTDRDLSSLVYGRLFRYENGVLTPDLASSLEQSEDGKAYTVTLREGVRWHDGEAFSAEDVLFTIKAIQDPDYKSPLRANWQGVTVEALNPHTVRFTLRQAYAPFVENLSVGVMPEHLWGAIPADAAILSDLNLKPVGTGPYRFRRFSRLSDGTITSVTLGRNEAFYRDGPYIDEIKFSFYPSEEKLFGAYRRGEIDSFLLTSRADLPSPLASDLHLHELRLPKLFALFLNQTEAPALARKPVRQALALAIDRPRLISHTLGGGGVEVNGPIPAGALGHNPDIASIPFDLELASSTLAKDGWRDSDGDGVRERTTGTGKNKKTETLSVPLATSDSPRLANAARMIADMWKALGAEVELKIIPVSELENTVIRPRNYGALLFGEVFGHDPDPYAFWHTSQLRDPGLNIALYANRSADKLLEEARTLTDAAKREEKYRAFQDLVHTDAPAIFLYTPFEYYAIRKNVEGIGLESLALPDERFGEVASWFINTRRVFK